jgi:ankyrin repeat protein
LHELGANLGVANVSGVTLAAVVAEAGNLDVLKLLSTLEPELVAEDASVAVMAALNGHLLVLDYLTQVGSLGGQRGHSWSPLVAAAFGGHTDAVTFLLQAGQEVGAITTGLHMELPAGSTAFQAAELKGHADIYTLLRASAMRTSPVLPQLPIPNSLSTRDMYFE